MLVPGSLCVVCVGVCLSLVVEGLRPVADELADVSLDGFPSEYLVEWILGEVDLSVLADHLLVHHLDQRLDVVGEVSHLPLLVVDLLSLDLQDLGECSCLHGVYRWGVGLLLLVPVADLIGPDDCILLGFVVLKPDQSLSDCHVGGGLDPGISSLGGLLMGEEDLRYPSGSPGVGVVEASAEQVEIVAEKLGLSPLVLEEGQCSVVAQVSIDCRFSCHVPGRMPQPCRNGNNGVEEDRGGGRMVVR